jgi:O-antigen/teichoic acid export membrane protein
MLRRFGRDVMAYLPSKLLPALTGFLSAPILTHLFSPAEYGSYALAVGLADLLFAAALSGIASVPVRFLPDFEVRNETSSFASSLLSLAFLLVLGVAMLAVGASFLFGSALSQLSQQLMLLSVLVFCVQAFFMLFQQMLRAQARTVPYTITELWGNYGSLGLGLLLVVVWKMGVPGMLWGMVACYALSFPWLLRWTLGKAKLSLGNYRPQAAREIWSYAWPLAMGNMAMWALRLSDRYVIGAYRTADDVGLYSVAYNLSGKSIDMLVALFLMTMGPIIMSTWAREGHDRTAKSLNWMTRAYLLTTIPAVVGLTVLAKPFVSLLTSPEYLEGYKIVGFVSLASMLYGFAQLFGVGILLRKQTGRIAINQVIAGGLNFVLNLFLVPRFGFVAAGVTTLLGYACLLALQAFSARGLLRWRFPFSSLLRSSLSAGVMALGILGLQRALPPEAADGNVIFLLLSVVMGIALYAITLWLSGEIMSQEKTVLMGVMRRSSENKP